MSFDNPPNLPPLNGAPIDFEQSLVAGHPTHPVMTFPNLVMCSF